MHEDTSPTMFALESWYQNAPQLDATAFAAALEKALGKIDIVSSSENSWTFALRDYPIQTDDGKNIFAMLSLMRPDHEQPFDHEARRSALEQSWDYPDAATELQNSRHSLLIHELLARTLPAADRWHIFRHATRVLVEQTRPQVLYNASSDSCYNPARWLENQQNGYHYYGVINVRYYTIADSEDMLMDTRGLDTFGLPDLQCHFRDLEPDDIAGLLYNTGIYLMQNGDVIEDGDTLGEDHWRCQRETAIIAPEREVLDICPNPPHAGGDRNP